MPQNDGFNGSTFSLGGSAEADVVGIRRKKSAPKVPVGGADDTKQLHVGGKPTESVTIEVNGVTSLDTGDTGTAIISYNDGSSHDLGNCEVFDVEDGGSENNPLTSTIEIGPTTS